MQMCNCKFNNNIVERVDTGFPEEKAKKEIKHGKCIAIGIIAVAVCDGLYQL